MKVTLSPAVVRLRIGPAGDVSGPPSSTDGAVAQFTGTTGRRLRAGPVIGSIGALILGLSALPLGALLVGAGVAAPTALPLGGAGTVLCSDGTAPAWRSLVAGDLPAHTHTAAQISDATAAGRALLTAADVTAQRTALGLGSLALASSVTAAQISDATAAGRALLTAADVTVQRTALGLGSLALASSVTAAQISDATAAGRAVLTAANVAAQRTALGLATVAASGLASDLSGAFTAAQFIDTGAGAITAGLFSPSFRVAAADATNARWESIAHGGAGLVLAARSIGGTRSVPTATPAGRTIFSFQAFGHDGTAYLTTASGTYLMIAPTLWSASNREVAHVWEQTLSGTTALVETMRLQGGSLCIGLGYTAGKGLLQVNGGIGMLQASGGDFSTGVWSRDANWGTYYRPASGVQADFALTDSSGNNVFFLKNAAIGIGSPPAAGQGLIQIALGTTVGNAILYGDTAVYRYVAGALHHAAPSGVDAVYRVARSTGEQGIVACVSGAGWYGMQSNHPLAFITNNASRLVISTTGRVSLEVATDPTAGPTYAASYLHLGAASNATVNGIRAITAGYTSGATNVPCAFGYQQTSIAGFTQGRFFVAVRTNTLDSAPTTYFSVEPGGSVVTGQNDVTALADGHLYIPRSAGAPTGTPTNQNGRVALCFDITNNRLYAYNSNTSAWKQVTLA